MNLAQRDRREELMDQPGLDPRQHHQALAALRRVNALSRTGAILWRQIRRCAEERPSSGVPLRILDVACGGGDVAVELARRARAGASPVEVAGCDLSETAIEYAERRARRCEEDVTFFVRDVLQDGLPEGFDIICSSLFLHHLEAADVRRLLEEAGRRARRAVVISDLERSRFGYALAWVGSHLLSRSPIVHYDGPVSVRGAFTISEMRTLAEEAGLTCATVRRTWPARYLLHWRRSPPSAEDAQ